MDLRSFADVKVGDVLWYITGPHTASRVRVIATKQGKQYCIVKIIDRAPSQPTLDQTRDGGLRAVHYLLEPIE